MSTITVQTISNGSVSTSSANVISGSAKAWVNFNGTGTVAIRASYNVSSITDNGTGNYTINMTNALADANYSVSATIGGVGAAFLLRTLDDITARTVSLFRINTLNVSTLSDIDPPQVNLAVFR